MYAWRGIIIAAFAPTHYGTPNFQPGYRLCGHTSACTRWLAGPESCERSCSSCMSVRQQLHHAAAICHPASCSTASWAECNSHKDAVARLLLALHELLLAHLLLPQQERLLLLAVRCPTN